MRFFVVEVAEVASCKCVTDLTEVAELAFPTAVVLLIKDVVVLVGIDYLIHTLDPTIRVS